MNERTKVALILVAVAAASGYLLWPSTNPGTGEPLVDVRVPDLDATAEAGETAFNTYCAACHGKNAAGQDGIAPPLVHVIYEPNHHADQAFYIAARQGVRQHHWPFGNMPPVEGITDDEIGKIVAYLRNLQRANDIY